MKRLKKTSASIKEEGSQILETTKSYARRRHSEDREDNDPTYTYEENDLKDDFLHLSFEEKESVSAYNIEEKQHLTFISV